MTMTNTPATQNRFPRPEWKQENSFPRVPDGAGAKPAGGWWNLLLFEIDSDSEKDTWVETKGVTLN